MIDAAARAEQHAGHETIGIAVSGSTAERLGADSPALAGRTLTLDALVARANTGTMQVDQNTTVFLDETGMVDHKRLDTLTALVERSGAKLIAVGDGKQLPSIGPGGMFDRLTGHAPTAELADIHRTKDPADQRAWQALRAGEPERAMAHYASRGQLHLSDTRDQAAEHAVQTWAALTEGRDIREVALIADAANTEIDRLNARAQHLRAQRGELGHDEIPLPSVHYGLREGDLIAFTTQHRPPGQPRVENGTRGQVSAIHDSGVTVTLDGSQRKIQLAGEQLDSLRLAYAQHVYRQQGATVERSVVLTGGWQTSKETAYVEATAPAKAPTGSSPATTSATKDKTSRASHGSPNRCATAARRPHRSRIPSAPTPAGRRAAILYGFAPPSRQHAGSPAHPTAIRPTAASVADADRSLISQRRFAQRATRAPRDSESRPKCGVSSSAMTERQSSEVEKVLLHVSDARSRARRAAEACAKDGAEAHIVAALADAERQLAELHRKLSQGTYYAVPDKSLKLAV